MLNRCPHCGRNLYKALQDGLTSCVFCNAVFDSSRTNKLLSGAWELIRSGEMCLDRFKFYSKLPDEDAHFVYSYILEQQYTIDEFRQVVKKIA